jgi:hypothetical protein
MFDSIEIETALTDAGDAIANALTIGNVPNDTFLSLYGLRLVIEESTAALKEYRETTTSPAEFVEPYVLGQVAILSGFARAVTLLEGRAALGLL